MGVPIVGESTNIIDVNVGIFNVLQYILHSCLSNVWRAFESHQESQVLIFAKWRNNGTEILTFFIKFKRIVLHTNVKFCEELAPRTLA
jgi:hypothetical protein